MLWIITKRNIMTPPFLVYQSVSAHHMFGIVTSTISLEMRTGPCIRHWRPLSYEIVNWQIPTERLLMLKYRNVIITPRYYTYMTGDIHMHTRVQAFSLK